MAEGVNLIQLREDINDIIYTESELTYSNRFDFKPTNNEEQIIQFSNNIVEFDIEQNLIIEPEKVCKNIYFKDDEQLILVRYILQDDNGGVIKCSINYDFVSGTTKYNICCISEQQQQDFFVEELGHISKIKHVVNDAVAEEHSADNVDDDNNDSFKNVLNENIVEHLTDEALSFSVAVNGKIDVDGMSGFNKEDNAELIERLQHLENISKNESNWEIGHFGVNGYDLNVSLVANAFKGAVADTEYLKRLRLIDWENNRTFNKGYLANTSKDEEKIKENLGIEANSIIPLIYDEHVSLLFSDKNNKLYQFDTGGNGREELPNIENKCVTKQRGECCGYSIMEYILNNKGILDIDSLKQDDEVINRKIIEYEELGNLDVTNYLISTNDNIALLNSGNLTPNETKKIFCESCYNINHISNLNTYTAKKDNKDTPRQLTVQWNTNRCLRQFRKKYNNKDKRGRLDILEEIKDDYKNKLKELVDKNDYNFVKSSDLDGLCRKGCDDLATGQQYIRKIILDRFKGFNKEYLENEANKQQKIKALKVNNKQQDKQMMSMHI